MSWPKHLKVDKRIIPLLSKATYDNFPRALRELISNAYDADATRVTIKMGQEAKSIIVEDNGNGMTPEQFDFYLRIAGRQRGKRESPKFKRKRIGQFGVGFLAVFPFTQNLEIISSAENSDVVFKASIPTSEFMRQDKFIEDIENIRIMGSERIEPSQLEKHYTIVSLSGASDLVTAYLTHKPRNVSRISIYSWEGLDKLKWELEEILPLQFAPSSKFVKLLKYPEPMGMEVWLNKEQLFRHDPIGEIVETHDGQHKIIGDVKFRYVITANNGPIHPAEARGLKFRVNNVGVGQRIYFDLNVLGKTYRNLLWLSGEIHVVEGLDEVIALNRDQITWNADYEKLVDFFRKRLSYHAEKLSTVLSATKEMESVIDSKITMPVASKMEIIDRNIDILKKKGFAVRFQPLAEHEAILPIQIDSRKKEVVIFKSRSAIKDSVFIGGKKRYVIYTDWNYEKNQYPACRFADDGRTIEVNTEYPLFKSKRYGEVFKRLHILFLIAKEETKNKEEMYRVLIENLMKDFEELI